MDQLVPKQSDPSFLTIEQWARKMRLCRGYLRMLSRQVDKAYGETAPDAAATTTVSPGCGLPMSSSPV